MVNRCFSCEWREFRQGAQAGQFSLKTLPDLLYAVICSIILCAQFIESRRLAFPGFTLVIFDLPDGKTSDLWNSEVC